MKKEKKHSDKELAQANIFPHDLSAEEKKRADEQLWEFRKKRLHEMTPDKLVLSRLMQLKFKMDDYISGSILDENYTFSYFLNEYIHSINVKKSDFSKEIDLHVTHLSRLLNDKDEPNEKILVRLELHSKNMIPAMFWLRVFEKQKELGLLRNTEIRKEESKHVKTHLTYLALVLVVVVVILVVYKSQLELADKSEVVASKINPTSNLLESITGFSRNVLGFFASNYNYQIA